MILSNPFKFARTLCVAAILSLLNSTSSLADDPPGKSPRPTAQGERFRAMEPAERLKLVEKLNATFTAVKRGDLVAAIVERGAVEPLRTFDVVCKAKSTGKEGAPATTIKWLIDEGSIVKKGDRIAQLDDTAIRDQLEVATVKLAQVEAAQAEGRNALEAAKIEGDIEIRLADIEVKLAEVELKEAAQGQMKAVQELKLDRAKLLAERARVRAKGQMVRAEAELRARNAAVAMEQRQVEARKLEMDSCVLRAPIDGIAVFYVPETSRFGGQAAMVAVGEPVREGQKLIRVVDLSKLAIATRVHESMISRVRTGQSTAVRIDAFPNLEVEGKVAQVSTVASPADWRTADVKVYGVMIGLDKVPAGLKPSMTAEVHIATGERKGVLQVPRNAVWTGGRDRICFVKVGKELQERQVNVGASSSTSVEIREGLKEGDEVLADLTAVLTPSAPSPGAKSPFGGKAK